MEDELIQARRELERVRAENVRLARLLDLRGQSTAPAPEQLAAAQPVVMSSSVGDKLALYSDLFRARTDVYALRWENKRTGASGWMPAVSGGWRKGMDRRGATYLPLTAEVVAAHLRGDVFIGLYPLLTTNRCHFLAADFDGPAAMLDALAYCKAARASHVPAAVEISQSGRGAHVWVFFAGAVPAVVARSVGTVLVHEAVVLRGSMDLRSYDRLFPNQDVLPDGGFGTLIAAPLQGGMPVAERRATVNRVAEAKAGDGVLVIGTTPFIGEGFDAPALDTLFLAGPISFDGLLIQCAGRVVRAAPGKSPGAEGCGFSDGRMLPEEAPRPDRGRPVRCRCPQRS